MHESDPIDNSSNAGTNLSANNSKRNDENSQVNLEEKYEKS